MRTLVLLLLLAIPAIPQTIAGPHRKVFSGGGGGSPVTSAGTPATGHSTNNINSNVTFTYTPAATGNALVFIADCARASAAATGATASATGYTITNLTTNQFDGFGNSRMFGTIAPNTSAASFTVSFTGLSNCSDFTGYWVHEFTGNDQTGGTTTFYAANQNANTSTGGCSGAAVTSSSSNDMVVAFCSDNIPTTNWNGSGWTKGVTDALGDGTEYKNASGSVTPTWASTSGAFAAHTVVIKAQ